MHMKLSDTIFGGQGVDRAVISIVQPPLHMRPGVPQVVGLFADGGEAYAAQ